MRHAILAAILVAGAALPSAPARAAATPDVFHSVSFVGSDLSVLPQWSDVLARIDRERTEIAACDAKPGTCSSLKLLVWRAQVAGTKAHAPDRMMYEINGFVNGLDAQKTCTLPEAGERWPGVADTIEGRGGTVGAAILKYASLREAGIPEADLRIMVAQDTLRGCRTAVLLARMGGTDYVLDTASNAPRRAALVRNLIPYYSFNASKLWIHTPRRQESTP